jgi:hypothetical protein
VDSCGKWNMRTNEKCDMVCKALDLTERSDM